MLNRHVWTHKTMKVAPIGVPGHGKYSNEQDRKWRSIGAESVLIGGSSAFLLLLSRVYPQFWYLSIIALIPLLASLTRARINQAAGLGLIFGATYFLFGGIDNLIAAPLGALPNILAGTFLFAAFGAGIGWLRNRFAINAIIIAILWVGCEWILVSLGIVKSIFDISRISQLTSVSIVQCLGFLIVSFLIVLSNALLISAVEKYISYRKRGQRPSFPKIRHIYFEWHPVYSKLILSPLPWRRGPPESSFCV